MSKKIILIVGIVIIIIGIVGAFLIIGNLPTPDEEEESYPSIKDMGVPFEHSANITTWNGGYSESDDCPWGAEHNGLDFFFENHSNIIAMIDGEIQEISVYTGSAPNKYLITLAIEYNPRMAVNYVFEPWTDDPAMRDLQISMFTVEEGDKVSKGDKIAEFLSCAGSAHIHLSVYDNDEAQCPKKHFSDTAYQEMMDLIHTYHSDWEMCYD